MKAILEFDLNDPEDREAHELAVSAPKLKRALEDVRNEIFRPARKHGYSESSIQSLMDTATPIPEGTTYALVDLLECKFNEILREHGVDA